MRPDLERRACELLEDLIWQSTSQHHGDYVRRCEVCNSSASIGLPVPHAAHCWVREAADILEEVRREQR